MITKEEVVRGATSRDVLAMAAFAALACLAIALDRAHGIAIFVGAVFILGIAAARFKSKRAKVAGFLLILVISLFSIGFNGVKFGIDFSGGVRIPVLLEEPVRDSATMEEMVSTIKTRAAAFGLTEAKVRPIGDSEIYVELPQSSPQLVKDVETVLSQQGVYQGIVDGKVAIRGDDIYSGTIGRVPQQYLQGADWAVSFTVTQGGAKRFADTAKGKADYPLYMYLDRPSNAVVVVSERELSKHSKVAGVTVAKSKARELAQTALRLEGYDIGFYVEEEIAGNFTLAPKDNATIAIVANGSALVPKLSEAGFVVAEKSEDEMSPRYSVSPSNPKSDAVSVWKAVGLLSAPRLVLSVTEGIPSFNYVINGPAEGETASAKATDAIRKEREVVSILKGGALPVRISLGSKTLVPAPLGAEFLRLSVIGVAFALVAISLMVALRYAQLKIVMPVMFISVSEVIILVAIIGSFTIDLSAMAGILAAVGGSVDGQIVMTDELLKKEDEEARKKLEKAFGIIMASVIVSVIAMVPLLFSGIVEVIGFAISTILGSLLGLFISRPAYGAIIERIFE